MSHINPSEMARRRFSKWALSAQSVKQRPTWTEQRLAIDFGGHTYIISNGQIYQCVHCGHFDPEWSVTEILRFFKDNLHIEPYHIEVICSVAVVKEDD